VADLPLLELPDVLAARRALAGVVVRTPVLRSDALDELAGARLFFKAEGLQVTGSFKVRGAYNRVRSFSPEEIARGLITVSAGNAALGAAWAARALGARLVVVMPENAVPEKLAGVAALGARIEKEGVTNATQAFERLDRLRKEHGYTLVHPFDDPYVIAGAGTATWELLEDAPDLEALALPASGGGLLSGALLAARALAPAAPVYGVQPAGADGIVRSLAAGKPTPPEKVQTVADGLTAPKPGILNFELIRRWAADVFTVTDEAILEAMGLILRHLKVIVEPAGAAALAGVLADQRFRGKRVGVLLSGSNTGMERVREVVGATARIDEAPEVRVRDLIGSLESGIPDLAENHRAYLRPGLKSRATDGSPYWDHKDQ
jgi:threonine dehydratase